MSSITSMIGYKYIYIFLFSFIHSVSSLTFMNLLFQMLDNKAIYDIGLFWVFWGFFCQHLSFCFTSRSKVSSRDMLGDMLGDFSTCGSVIFFDFYVMLAE